MIQAQQQKLCIGKPLDIFFTHSFLHTLILYESPSQLILGEKEEIPNGAIHELVNKHNLREQNKKSALLTNIQNF